MGFLLCRAEIDGEERLSVIPESGLPHMPQWTAVDPDDVRPQPWDFEEPEADAAPAVGPAVTAADPVDGAPGPVADEPPAGNASATEWRAYAQTHLIPDPDAYTRDELRDHFLNNQPLPAKES